MGIIILVNNSGSVMGGFCFDLFSESCISLIFLVKYEDIVCKEDFMSYIIEPMPLITFLDNSKFKLPRFQRKATWDKKQNFELCISVFQDYPVGVVIVNQEQKVSWLLDGRQRRNALTNMRDNPVALYEWARNYIGFAKNLDELQLQDAYWGKVEKYLQTEERTVEDDSEDVYEGEEVGTEENSFDSVKQRHGLQTLLDIILMVHQNKPSGSKWELTFDFRKYFSRLKYAPPKNGSKIDPVLLRRFILEIIKSAESDGEEGVTETYFIDYFLQNFNTTEEEKFRNEVKKRWTQISFSIDVVNRSEKIFEDARIGVIRLTNASPLDAQNIFSRINRGGTQLKAEELLSAKPYWNKEIQNPDASVMALAKEMYLKLGIPMANNVVRWDLAATLIDRIEDQMLLFDTYTEAKKKNEVAMDQITLGFKLLSSVYEGGMSNKHVVGLEYNDAIDWENDIDTLVSELNTVCNILLNDSFFAFLKSWKKPITKLLGIAIALEFITIMWLDWRERGKPQFVVSGEMKALQRDGRILFDRLVYEYATRSWRGSGDSKMASDIKNWKTRIQPIDETAWQTFIEGACHGMYNGQPTTVKLLRPVLYYYYVLTQCTPINQTDVSFDVDHIIPQELFVGNMMADTNFENSLSNLALLPTKANISKKAKRLNEITDAWLKKQIVIYSGVREAEFETYSDVTNIEVLRTQRKALFTTAFSSNRKTELSN